MPPKVVFGSAANDSEKSAYEKALKGGGVGTSGLSDDMLRALKNRLSELRLMSSDRALSSTKCCRIYNHVASANRTDTLHHFDSVC